LKARRGEQLEAMVMHLYKLRFGGGLERVDAEVVAELIHRRCHIFRANCVGDGSRESENARSCASARNALGERAVRVLLADVMDLVKDHEPEVRPAEEVAVAGHRSRKRRRGRDQHIERSCKSRAAHVLGNIKAAPFAYGHCLLRHEDASRHEEQSRARRPRSRAREPQS